jgi:hypothetical protein
MSHRTVGLHHRWRQLLILLMAAACLGAQQQHDIPLYITTPKEALGFNIGDDYQIANYTQLESYWKKLASESDRMRLIEIGRTAEGRPHYMAIVTSPENQKNLARYKTISSKLAHAEGISEAEAHALAREGKAIVWIDGGLHANETVGSQQLMETVYQLVSRTDAETTRLLRDDIVLCVVANPDGQEMVANWYMREKNAPKRSLTNLPRLYNKYVGHDDNRDFYMSNMPETTNINRQLFIEWFPQIVYNHHQTGPAGAVIFMPPFRDPFNYNFDPLIPLGIEMVGTAMHSRLVAEGKGGSTMRSAANYSTWWNGGLRTIAYFHNMIGLLTEIIGSPAPIDIPLVPEKQIATGDWPLPIAPGKWHYRQSIDYEISNNYAVLDVASRYRETFLFNLWRMGMNSVVKGSRDNWTVTPRRIEALKSAAARSGTAGVPPSLISPRLVSPRLYDTILHDPKYRDPRGYIIPADQADFPTATKFINALLRNGITVMRATSAFTVNAKTYPGGSWVIKTAQAFRPHIMDMFEPQDHPDDFRYPGGPPIAPYDITGWTLALQMGVEFDRILDDFDGPFRKVDGVAAPPPAEITGPRNAAGWLISHRQNDSFILVNRLLKANCAVYWLTRPISAEGRDFGTGAIWVPATSMAKEILELGGRQLGVAVRRLASAPATAALQLHPTRIGLYDQYGGLISSGWTRWLLEQFEFPFQIVYPRTLDEGDLKSRFDVLVFVNGAARLDSSRAAGARSAVAEPDPETIPEQYRRTLGHISEDKTVPQLRKFLAAGGSVVTMGSSTGIATALGVPVRNALAEMGADGKEHPIPAAKFYVPGSLLKVTVDNTNPLAFGMPDRADVFFENSPVFKLLPDAARRHVAAVAWFEGPDVLASGWAWGQQYLSGATAIVEASVGEGRVVMLGPEVAFRAQPHGTFKLLFNALCYGTAEPVELK